MLDAAKIRVCSVVDTHVPIGLLVPIPPCRSGWLRKNHHKRVNTAFDKRISSSESTRRIVDTASKRPSVTAVTVYHSHLWLTRFQYPSGCSA